MNDKDIEIARHDAKIKALEIELETLKTKVKISDLIIAQTQLELAKIEQMKAQSKLHFIRKHGKYLEDE